MEIRLKLTAVLLVLACAAGNGVAQTTPFRIPASEATIRAVQSTQAVILLKQSEIEADPMPAARPQQPKRDDSLPVTNVIAVMPRVGLLDVLLVGVIEQSVRNAQSDRQDKAAKVRVAVDPRAVLPIRTALEGYPFRDNFHKAVSDGLKDVAWLRLTEVKVDKPMASGEDRRSGMSESAYLLLNTRYSMAGNLEYLRLSCVSVLMPNHASLSEIAGAERPDDKFSRLYRNQFVHIQKLSVQPASVEEAALRWSEDGGARIRAALDEAIAEIAALIAKDLRDAAAPAAREAPVKTVRLASISAKVLSETPARYVLELPNGTVRSIPKRVLAEAENPAEEKK